MENGDDDRNLVFERELARVRATRAGRFPASKRLRTSFIAKAANQMISTVMTTKSIGMSSATRQKRAMLKVVPRSAKLFSAWPSRNLAPRW